MRELLAAHLAFARTATPAEYSFALDIEQLVDPSVTFFSARQDGRLLGIAAFKALAAGHGELKSMHTREAERGRGTGRALVKYIIAFAKGQGFRRISLETGTEEVFLPARSLYVSLGFIPCEAFGDYQASAYNTFMTMRLDED